jgi:hypothetical protein
VQKQAFAVILKPLQSGKFLRSIALSSVYLFAPDRKGAWQLLAGACPSTTANPKQPHQKASAAKLPATSLEKDAKGRF